MAPRLLRGRALEAAGRWTAAAECYAAVGVGLLFYTTRSFIISLALLDRVMFTDIQPSRALVVRHVNLRVEAN